MDLVFDIASSAEFWRQRYPLDRAPDTPPPVLPDAFACRLRDIEPLLPKWMDEQFLAPNDGALHMLTTDQTRRKKQGDLVIHSWSGPIPEGSFYQLKGPVFVESPAFMFLHAASVLNFNKLVAFGDELCGLYSFDKREDRGFRKREQPLITKAQVEQFLARSEGCRGANTASRALQYVVERSASPMETFDEMTMCLPFRHGGYTLFPPIMNERVDLTPNAARVARRSRCFLDMGYRKHNLDIEHHGKHDHSSDEEKDSDRERVAGLREMGIEVIELTSHEVYDLAAYEIIIQRIARIIGKRLRPSDLGPKPARLELRKDIFDWNASNGKIR